MRQATRQSCPRLLGQGSITTGPGHGSPGPSPSRRWLQPVLALVVLALLLGWPVSPGGAGTVDDETAFVTMINDLRVSRGLNPLVVDAELTALARQWSDVMAGDDQLKHAGDLAVGVSAPWDVLGENVGVHSVHDLDALFQAFVASPAHLENLLDARFDRVGVGVTYSASGHVWTTHRFLSVPGSEAAATTAAPAATTTITPIAAVPTTSPAPPATTAAPTTTTVPASAPASAPPAPPSPVPSGPVPSGPVPSSPALPGPVQSGPVPSDPALPGPVPSPSRLPASPPSWSLVPSPGAASRPISAGSGAGATEPEAATTGHPARAVPAPAGALQSAALPAAPVAGPDAPAPPGGAAGEPQGSLDRQLIEQLLIELAAIGI